MSTEETNDLHIDPEVNNKLNAFRAAANGIRNQIGGLEIEKFKLVGRLGEIEREAQSLLNHEAQRLGIPSGQQWAVAPNGQIQVGPPQGTVEAPAPAPAGK
jgi:hypothetical protein